MITYVEEVLREKLSVEGVEYTPKQIATELRKMLGDEKIREIFRCLLHNADVRSYNPDGERKLCEIEKVNEEKDYNYYWVATKLIEMDEAGESEDGFKYPSHGWINGELCEELNLITKELNRLRGVHCDNGCIYEYGTCYNTKAMWSIDFETVEDFNHFLWAGCYRYLPLSKEVTWRLTPNLGDPDYREKRIRMELHYCLLDTKKDEILEHIKKFADCVKTYADEEEEIREKLSE